MPHAKFTASQLHFDGFMLRDTRRDGLGNAAGVLFVNREFWAKNIRRLKRKNLFWLSS